MLIKTVACGTKDSESVELKFNEIEYDDVFAEKLSSEISEYYIHTVFTYDYESSSDAGSGRDDYYTEEEDVEIQLNQCVVQDDKFFGVVCESFGVQCLLSLNQPEIVIYHPQNYEGRNYHFYRKKQFKLIKK